MNTYRATSKAAEAVYAPDVFERDFTIIEEQDALASGLLEIVPRPYKILSDNYAAGIQGEQVDLALPAGIEAALLVGGHLERVDKPPTKKTKKD